MPTPPARKVFFLLATLVFAATTAAPCWSQERQEGNSRSSGEAVCDETASRAAASSQAASRAAASSQAASRAAANSQASGSKATQQSTDHFHRDRLAAWCIVPFDAKKRGPAERAEMVRRLGMTRVAYDWREEHVATFEEEILQYEKHGIEFFAFWGWHEAFEALITRHKIQPQIWLMFGAPADGSQEQKIKAAAEGLLPMVEKTRQLNLQLGLYNHGGWSGEPQNMVAVCDYLRTHHDAAHVGIVYNLHHGHEHISDFASQLKMMQPHLICLNLNGMNDHAQPKILPIGEGQHDKALLQIIRESEYTGPLGIIDHRDDMDSEISLQQNLTGLKSVLEQIGDQESAATYDSPMSTK